MKFSETKKKISGKNKSGSDSNNQNGISSENVSLIEDQDVYDASERGVKPTVTVKEGHEVFGEEDSNGYTAPISSRDEDLLDPSDSDFDRRKFSAASVDILIDGLDLKREKEKASGAKK